MIRFIPFGAQFGQLTVVTVKYDQRYRTMVPIPSSLEEFLLVAKNWKQADKRRTELARAA